jgi:hypothetical protein
MDSAAKFKFKQAQFDAEVKRFAEASDVGSIIQELATAKALLNELVDNATTPAERQRILPITRDILKTIATLSAAHTDRMLRANEMLSKDSLRKFITAVCQIVCESLDRKFIGWEDTVDEITSRLGEAVEAANNGPAPKVKLLK